MVAEHLYRDLPELPEGDLARIRAAVVSEPALAEAAGAAAVGGALLLGRGEAHSGGRLKPSILADALEAIVGATYLSGGIDDARALVEDVLGDAIAAASATRELGDAKNRLQELCARLGLDPPGYTLHQSGPDHARRFVAEVAVAGPPGAGAVGRGEGRSKKQAERAAALDALANLSGADRA